jgi:hypothetical protein
VKGDLPFIDANHVISEDKRLIKMSYGEINLTDYIEKI